MHAQKTTPTAPNPWLRELARLAPARFPWELSIRALLAASVPLAVGLAIGQFTPSILVAMGALMGVVGNLGGPYRAQFRQLAIEAPMAAAGYLLGQAVFGHGWWTAAAVVLAALISGLVSGYGGPFSVGGMQFLIFVIASSANPPSGPLWVEPVLFLCGSAWVAVLLLASTIIDRRKPQRWALRDILHSLAALARAMEGSAAEDNSRQVSEVEAARRSLTDTSAKAYGILLAERGRAAGRTKASDHAAEVLAALSEVAPVLLASAENGPLPPAAREWLEAMATAVESSATMPPPAPAGLNALGPRTRRRLAAVRDAIWPSAESSGEAGPGAASAAGQAARPAAGPTAVSATVAATGPSATAGESSGTHGGPPVATRRQHLSATFRLSQLILGRDVIVSAVRIALCVGVAVLAMELVPGTRSYWIPITVAMVLKPDFGSVFARAIQRSAGTLAGVLIGVAILSLLPKGPLLVVALALLGALLPWSAMRGYALQAVVLTPLVLVLFDLMMPGPGTVDYGAQRLLDTVIGGVIVLLFGYLLWPRSLTVTVEPAFREALDAIDGFLSAATGPLETPESRRALTEVRRASYRRLSDARTQLQRALSEPPPASREAVAWFPAVTAAERLCDHITILGEHRKGRSDSVDPGTVLTMSKRLDSAADTVDAHQPDDVDKALTRSVDSEIRRLTAALQD